ncbi:MAG: peptidylprolyl isomerase [Verrucomicrobiota bacterium]
MKGIIISCSHRWLAGHQWSRVFLPFLLGMVHAAGVRAGAPPDTNAGNTIAVFDFRQGTNAMGRVSVELFDQDKPETVGNFLLYVWSGAYSNSLLHRCVPGFVLQGGGFSVTNPAGSDAFSSYVEAPDYGRLTNEFLVGARLSNTLGTLAMAKLGGDPNSATSQWFFNLGDNSTNLDAQNGGFAVFGRVLDSTNANEGIAVLQSFNSLSTNAGIVDLGSLLGTNYDVFNSLPVAYTNTVTRVPLYQELYYTDISILNETNAPSPAPPTVSVLSPPPNSSFTNQTVVVRGTAADDAAVARVVCCVQNGPWEIASGTTNWGFALSPAAGYNTLTVESIDWAGNRSAGVAVSFYYEARFPLDLQIVGNGTVKGLTNGASLMAGAYYTATANPALNYVFDSWSGSVTSSSPDLTFQVPLTATNFSLTAKFIPDPVRQLAGSYQGLIQTSDQPTLDGAGFLSLALQTSGGFSGSILYHGATYYYTGKFDSAGGASVSGTLDTISTVITLQLQTTNSAGLITGTMTIGSASPAVQLERLASNLGASNGPPAGQYTFALPATAAGLSGPMVPGGSGFGTLSLAQSGTLSLSGVLGDGTPLTTSCSFTRLGHWPLYVTLDKGKGVVLGWVGVSSDGPGNLYGSVQWVRSMDVGADSYPGGFSNQVWFVASHYAPPAAGARVLNWVYGQAQISGNDLVPAITNLVKLSTSNTLSVVDSNALLKLSLDLKSGRVSGSFVHPWFGYTNALNGVLLEGTGSIFGQYTHARQTGGLEVEAVPFLVTQSVASVSLPALAAALSDGGLLRFEDSGTIVLTNAIVPQYDTALDANGHSVVLSGGGVSRLVEVRSNLTFSAQGLIFADGFHAGTNGASASPPGPAGDGQGAGILNIGGTVALTNCVFTNCVVRGGDAGPVTATNGASPQGGRGLGGAICNRGGQLTLEGCLLADCSAGGGQGGGGSPGPISMAGATGLGGAIFSDSGACLVENSTFLRNRALGGEPLTNSETNGPAGHAAGGALAIAGGTLLLHTSQALTNAAAGAVVQLDTAGGGHGCGGALFVESNATASLEQVTLSGNSASGGGGGQTQEPGNGLGGALYNAGSLDLEGCSLEYNAAVGGFSRPAGRGLGGALAAVGPVVVNACTFNDNLAQGGDCPGSGTNGATAGAEGFGGAIQADAASVAVTNATFAFNRAAGGAGTASSPEEAAVRTNGFGGALALSSTNVWLMNLTLAFNTAVPGSPGDTNASLTLAGGIANLDGTVTLRNSILASNAPANFSGQINDGGCNFSSDSSAAFTASNSVVNVNPLLGPLTINGGPTLTMAISPSSPAFDAVQTSYPPVDQCGTPRPQGRYADSGAFELVLTVPLFTLQPSGTNSVRAGESCSLQALAEGPGPIGYLWSKDGVLVDGLSGATVTLTNVQASDGGLYAAVATNSFGAVTSTVEMVSVDLRPYIVTQPQDATVAPNGSASFTVSAAGPSLSFLWLHNDLPISSATNAVVTISEAAPGDQGTYQVIVTNPAGSATSRVATLSFNSAALDILSQPRDFTVAVGKPASFFVVAIGSTPISYQWLLGNLAIPGQTNQVLSFAHADRTNAGAYSVVVTNAYRAVTSAPAALIVVRQPTLSISAQGTNLLLTCYGDPDQVHRLLGATNLHGASSWMPLATNVVPSNGTILWSQAAPSRGAVYFRAVTP